MGNKCVGWKTEVGGGRGAQAEGRARRVDVRSPASPCRPPTCRKELLRSSAHVILPDHDLLTL